MVDTVKIPRPKFPRDPNGPNGRVEHDARGNAVWKKTRASDSPELPDTSTLAIADEVAEKSWDSGATLGGAPQGGAPLGGAPAKSKAKPKQ